MAMTMTKVRRFEGSKGFLITAIFASFGLQVEFFVKFFEEFFSRSLIISQILELEI